MENLLECVCRETHLEPDAARPVILAVLGWLCEPSNITEEMEMAADDEYESGGSYSDQIAAAILVAKISLT